jgi:hypothetical protein
VKRCFKCLCSKPFAEFYKHAEMSDGHLNKCKECTKKDANAHRQANLERVRSYDRLRGSQPHRVAARIEYAKSDRGRTMHSKACAAYRLRHASPNPRIVLDAATRAARRRARVALGNAIRDGKVARWPCEVCGAKAHAHHPHYDAPLLVTWLCPSHHKQAHALIAEVA